MTKQEAIELETKCDEIVSEYLNEKCTVSMALTGRLKVNFGDNYFSFEKDMNTVNYVMFHGFYSDLENCINTIRKCFRDNKKLFKNLLCSYANIDLFTE